MDKIIQILTINNIDELEPRLMTLAMKNINTVEITFRTDCAEKALTLAVAKFPKMTIGAGTIINEEQCLRAINVGAKFIVSPGLSEEVARVCKKYSTPYYPGCVTPTEIMRAISLGITIIKFFPASLYGGLNAIKALSKPFPQIKFIPTGGIAYENVKEYLAFDKVFAVGGSFDLEKIK